eukprot:TRINITY_DN19621_c0_g1_i3.p2 TRINITY_DN19621_c0_g1~~TRINITY_DN19621_c0_g1_i3.p2  ORF type:complete len:196 (-),score=38.59 TRINITY_DN19621_c0_g1_i3:243-830(-)
MCFKWEEGNTAEINFGDSQYFYQSKELDSLFAQVGGKNFSQNKNNIFSGNAFSDTQNVQLQSHQQNQLQSLYTCILNGKSNQNEQSELQIQNENFIKNNSSNCTKKFEEQNDDQNDENFVQNQDAGVYQNQLVNQNQVSNEKQKITVQEQPPWLKMDNQIEGDDGGDGFQGGVMEQDEFGGINGINKPMPIEMIE